MTRAMRTVGKRSSFYKGFTFNIIDSQPGAGLIFFVFCTMVSALWSWSSSQSATNFGRLQVDSRSVGKFPASSETLLSLIKLKAPRIDDQSNAFSTLEIRSCKSVSAGIRHCFSRPYEKFVMVCKIVMRVEKITSIEIKQPLCFASISLCSEIAVDRMLGFGRDHRSYKKQHILYCAQRGPAKLLSLTQYLSRAVARQQAVAQ